MNIYNFFDINNTNLSFHGEVNSDGTKHIIYENNVEKFEYPNGEIKIIDRDEQRIVYPGGRIEGIDSNLGTYYGQIESDVSNHLFFNNGVEHFEYLDGSLRIIDNTKNEERYIYPDGRVEGHDENGNYFGEIITKGSKIGIQKIKYTSTDIERWIYPNGKEKFIYPDGESRKIYPSGEIKGKDCKRAYTGKINSNNSQFLKYDDNSERVIYKDTKNEIKYNDESNKTIYPGGRIEGRDRMGEFYGEVLSDKSQRLIYPKREIERLLLPDGVEKILYKNGDIQIIYPDGSIKGTTRSNTIYTH